MNTTKPVPKDIKAADGMITIRWNDDHVSSYVARKLRLLCRCAACVDERTQQVIIDVNQVPQNLKPEKISVVGNYALHFTWSDGHDTGIYAYDYLRGLCGCKECMK